MNMQIIMMMMWKRMIISFPHITLFKAEHLKGELCDDILLHLIAKKIEKIMTKTFCTIKDIILHEQMIKDISWYDQMLADLPAVFF